VEVNVAAGFQMAPEQLVPVWEAMVQIVARAGRQLQRLPRYGRRLHCLGDFSREPRPAKRLTLWQLKIFSKYTV